MFWGMDMAEWKKGRALQLLPFHRSVHSLFRKKKKKLATAPGVTCYCCGYTPPAASGCSPLTVYIPFHFQQHTARSFSPCFSRLEWEQQGTQPAVVQCAAVVRQSCAATTAELDLFGVCCSCTRVLLLLLWWAGSLNGW